MGQHKRTNEAANELCAQNTVHADTKIYGNETKAKTPSRKAGLFEQWLLEKRGVFEQWLLEEPLAGRVAYNDKSLITNFTVSVEVKVKVNVTINAKVTVTVKVEKKALS